MPAEGRFEAKVFERLLIWIGVMEFDDNHWTVKTDTSSRNQEGLS